MRRIFSESAKELRKTRSLVAMAMLLALAVVLGFVSVQVTESLRVGFSFLPNALAGQMFGPVGGMLVGGLADILKYIVKPTGPFFPGFTISGVLGGLIYGLVLYKKPTTLPRVILSQVLIAVFVNMLLNTYWLTILYGNSFLAIWPARIVSNLITLPINIILYYLVATLLEKAGIRRQFGGDIIK